MYIKSQQPETMPFEIPQRAGDGTLDNDDDDDDHEGIDRSNGIGNTDAPTNAVLQGKDGDGSCVMQ